jgi:phosphate transport system permease protein
MSTTTNLEPNQDLIDRVARRRRHQKTEQKAITVLLFLAALISVLTTVGVIVLLVSQSAGFFAEVSIWKFLTGTEWAPHLSPEKSGVVELVSGTLLVAVVAGIVSLTLGLGAAIFLSEYAPEKLRQILKPILEVLAGIPTVVYGYFALTFMTPLFQTLFGSEQVSIFNALSAGIVMGLMIMPMVSTLSEDAMVAVPRSLRDAAYALGATRFEVATKVVMPAALSGIVASFILAMSRAIGETMIVKIAAGAQPNLTLNPLESIQTMTAYIVQISGGEAAQGSFEYKTIFAVGLLLFTMTLIMNIVGRWVISRFRQQYE